MSDPYIMNITPEELFTFLVRQIGEYEEEMTEHQDADQPSEYAYAWGSRDAYKFVLRTLIEYGRENK
jgi:hypothetical protein